MEKLVNLQERLVSLMQKGNGLCKSSDGIVELHIFPPGTGSEKFSLVVHAYGSKTFKRHDTIGPKATMEELLNEFELRLDKEEKELEND